MPSLEFLIILLMYFCIGFWFLLHSRADRRRDERNADFYVLLGEYLREKIAGNEPNGVIARPPGGEAGEA